jgi:myosin-1
MLAKPAPPAGMSYPTSTPKPSAPSMTASAPAARAAPPPPPRAPAPPPAPAKPSVPIYKALYNFEGQAGEMNLTKDGQYEVKEKDDNGWWLVVKNGQEGWAPS